MVREGFIQTQIGVIPEDWEVRFVKEFTACTAGGTPNTQVKEFWNGNIPWMNSGELNKKKVSTTENFITDLGLKNSSTKLIPKNCVLIGLAGQGKTRGTIAINMIELCINQSIGAFLPNKNYSYKFLYFNLENRYEELRGLSSGDGGRGGLNLNILKHLQISLPPLPEQKAIAEALNDADTWIESLEQLIAKKRLIKQGAMQDLLRPKEGWEVRRLGEVCDVVGGGTPSTFNSSYWNGNVEWFTPTEVGKTKYLFSSKRLITELGLKNSSASILPINTILLTSRAGIGDLGILKVQACTNQGFQSLVCKANTNHEFMYYLMKTKKNELLSNASGSTFLEISPGKVKALLIDIPSFSEQTRIATILSDMDTELENLENQLSKARQIKQGMMQDLLTGRIRLI